MTNNNDNNNDNNNNNNNNFIERLINKALGDKASTYQSDNDVSIQPAVTVDMIPYTFDTLESSINQKLVRPNVVSSSSPSLLEPVSSSLSPAALYSSSSASSMDNLKTNNNINGVQKSTGDDTNDFINSTIELKEDKNVSNIVQFGQTQIQHDRSEVLKSVDSSTSLYDKKPEVLKERNTTKKYDEDNEKDHLIFRNRAEQYQTKKKLVNNKKS